MRLALGLRYGLVEAGLERNLLHGTTGTPSFGTTYSKSWIHPRAWLSAEFEATSRRDERPYGGAVGLSPYSWLDVVAELVRLAPYQDGGTPDSQWVALAFVDVRLVQVRWTL